MRYTPNLNLPVPEEGDKKSDFPLTVDGPRTDALDAHLGRKAFALTPANNHTFSTNRVIRQGYMCLANISLTPTVTPVTAMDMAYIPDLEDRPPYDSWFVLGSTTGASYLGSVFTTGRLAWRGGTFPAANVPVYGTIAWEARR